MTTMSKEPVSDADGPILRARFESRCGGCDALIRPGDMIQMVRGFAVHYPRVCEQPDEVEDHYDGDY